ncbi:MAG: 4Fe-4S dicluster domain-containing protein [Anaerolineales bacterium]|nr:4Fe-4S dicluster domain-containing protein [Anaerolineales bacterium]MCB9172918.1 4Fe-4S dicluster domain-containing protein [Ardenticatenales bacterium]
MLQQLHELTTQIVLAAEGPQPFRDNFWNIPHGLKYALYAGILIATLALFYGMWQRMSLYFKGKAEQRLDHLPQRMERVLAYIFGQLRIARQSYAGTMHLLIFWAFLVLLLGTSLATVDADFLEPFGYKMLDNHFYLFYEFALDTFGFFFLIGLGMGWYRRYVKGSVKLSYDWGWAFMLGLLFLINLTGFWVEGLRLAVWQPDWQLFSPFGFLTAQVINLLGLSEGVLRTSHQILWVAHFVLVAIFMVGIPYTPLMHLVTSPLNILFSRIEDEPRKERTLQPIPDIEEQEVWGVGELSHFSWAQLLQFDACTECGRCQVACPAWNAGTALNPKHLILDLRNEMLRQGNVPHSQLDALNGHAPAAGGALVGEVIRDETLWACTTCRACVYECPVLIDHVTPIVDMRRFLTMTEGRMPDSVSGTMRNLERAGNPWGYRQDERDAWTQKLDFEVPRLSEEEEVEYLYFVGCLSSFDDRNQRIARAVVTLLEQAGVNYAILGKEETCTGDPARRLGNEYLYQIMAERTIETLNNHSFKTVITSCPHCFNALGNEYEQFGGGYQTIHHSELLADLVKRRRLQPRTRLDETVTYHDPCYLGRYNDVFDAPRELLAAIPGVEIVEMGRSREQALCCGGGGGGVFMEVHGERRINDIRLQEAAATGAGKLAAGCPFCVVMFDSAGAVSDDGGGNVLIPEDVAELLLRSVGE